MRKLMLVDFWLLPLGLTVTDNMPPSNSVRKPHSWWSGSLTWWKVFTRCPSWCNTLHVSGLGTSTRSVLACGPVAGLNEAHLPWHCFTMPWPGFGPGLAVATLQNTKHFTITASYDELTLNVCVMIYIYWCVIRCKFFKISSNPW